MPFLIHSDCYLTTGRSHWILLARLGIWKLAFIVSRSLGIKEVSGTSGNQARINTCWLIKGRQFVEQVSPHMCGLENMSLYMPTAACLWTPTGQAKHSHFSYIYSLWNFSFNMTQGICVSQSGVNAAIITPEMIPSFCFISLLSQPCCHILLSLFQHLTSVGDIR